MSSKLFAYDIEVFKNYFLAVFVNSEELHTFEIHQIQEMLDFIHDKEKILIGYNSHGYDDVMMKFIAQHSGFVTMHELHKVSNEIVSSRKLGTDLFKLQYSECPWKYSVDIYQYMNRRGSLKEWECREQMDIVMESPVDFTKPLPVEDIEKTREYCITDARATWQLFQKYKYLATIREKLKTAHGLTNRVHCVGEAGLAEMVIMSMHTARTGERKSAVVKRASTTIDNKATEWPLSEIISPKVAFLYGDGIEFLKELKTATIKACDEHRTKWALPPEWQIPVKIGNLEYQLGVGGLHSVDTPGKFHEDKNNAIIDMDVTSYYPSIIIEENLFPKQIGSHFVTDFRKIRDTRVAAKKLQQEFTKSGDTVKATEHKHVNEALKIVINSTFGKLNDRYSPLRSIPDALRVTINGQLFLLMLIERLCKQMGAEIISANTDGVTFKIPRYRIDGPLGLSSTIEQFKTQTGHDLERTDYSCYIRRDVNSYVAMTLDGKIKAKGSLTPYPLTGKWDNIVSIIAAQQYLTKGIDPKKTIKSHKNPKDFLFYQMAKNGGTIFIDDEPIGKLARWYTAKTGGQIRRRNPNGSFAKIPHGESAVLALDVGDWNHFGLPDDVNFDAYIEKAWSIIYSTGKE